MGGSLGAKGLNDRAREGLRAAVATDPELVRSLQVIHSTGHRGGGALYLGRVFSALGLRHFVAPFIPDVGTALRTADLVLCRGGAGTLAEVEALARPAVIVPYPHHADRQQWKNAERLLASGLATLVEEASLDAETFANRRARSAPRGLGALRNQRFRRRCGAEISFREFVRRGGYDRERTRPIQRDGLTRRADMTPPPVIAESRPTAGPRTLEGHRAAYLVGIGGTGMCGAAELLRARGLSVRGSDRQGSRRTERLARMDIPVDVGDDAAPLPAQTTVVVASAAVAPDHPQLVEARAPRPGGLEVRRVPRRPDGGSRRDRVAGCHGKTTTSSLVATTLWRAGRDPSFVIGGDVRDLATSARPGRGPHFVAEACEFDRSFHRLRPEIAVVTNLDADHLDYYRDIEEIRESFRDFARLLPARGLLVVHEDHAAVFRDDPLLRARRSRRTGRPRPPTGARATPGGTRATRCFRWRSSHDGQTVGLLALPLAGLHNVLNATGAARGALRGGARRSRRSRRASPPSAASAGAWSAWPTAAACSCSTTTGTTRPRSRAVLRAVRTRWPGRRLVVVFQPHQASRTRALLDEFGDGARRGRRGVAARPSTSRATPRRTAVGVSGETWRRASSAAAGRRRRSPSLAAIVAHAARSVRPGDVVVTMGAGDVDTVARGLADRLR